MSSFIIYFNFLEITFPFSIFDYQVVFVASLDKEKTILDLEASIAEKDERLGNLKAELFKVSWNESFDIE